MESGIEVNTKAYPGPPATMGCGRGIPAAVGKN